jgi:hypothetical protein
MICHTWAKEVLQEKKRVPTARFTGASRKSQRLGIQRDKLTNDKELVP